MAEPGYDFFATGRPVTATPTPPVGPMPTAAPARVTPVPGARVFDTPTGAVNQFGTPVDRSNVPTGPYAAPGIGAAPSSAPGMVSTWDAPPQEHAPASPERFGTGPGLPAGVAGRGTPGPAVHSGSHRSATSAAATARPGAVLAAGIIGIVVGAGMLGLGVLSLLTYLALRSRLAELESQLAAFGDADGAAAFAAAPVGSMAAAVLITAVACLAVGSGYLVAGIATTRGRRWGAWALLAVSSIYVLGGLYQLTSGRSGLAGLSVGFLVSGAVVVLLALRDSQRWLRTV